MNRETWIFALIALALILGIGGFLLWQNLPDPKGSSVDLQKISLESVLEDWENEKYAQSFAKLRALAKDKTTGQDPMVHFEYGRAAANFLRPWIVNDTSASGSGEHPSPSEMDPEPARQLVSTYSSWQSGESELMTVRIEAISGNTQKAKAAFLKACSIAPRAERAINALSFFLEPELFTEAGSLINQMQQKFPNQP